MADLKVRTPTEETTVRIGFARRGAGYTITTVPLETYVARVVAGEAAHDSPPAALDALAIAVRTFALANRRRHRADGFDLCSETHCQVVRTATATTEASAARTNGRILVAGGAPASIYYTASCGGYSELRSAVSSIETGSGVRRPPFVAGRDRRPRSIARSSHRRLPRRPPSRAAHHRARWIGPCRAAPAGRPDASRNLGTRSANDPRPHTRMASDQEHVIRHRSHGPRLSVDRSRRRPRRRPLRHRVDASGSSR